jgi:hypothetical protein
MSESNPATASTPDDFRDTRSVEWKLAAVRKNWTPHREEEQPRVLSGLVLDVGTRPSDYDQGDVPAILLLAKDGTEWSVVGFHAILRSELKSAGPRIGDRLGIHYQGEGKAREGQSPPHLYRAVVERNPEGPQERDPQLAVTSPSGGPIMDTDDIPFAPTSLDSSL